jgi:hypothetical protein
VRKHTHPSQPQQLDRLQNLNFEGNSSLKVTYRLDRRRYPLGREITDEEMANVNLVPDNFHGEWNYTIQPPKKLVLRSEPVGG